MFGGNDSVLDFFLGSVKFCLCVWVISFCFASCNLSSFPLSRATWIVLQCSLVSIRVVPWTCFAWIHLYCTSLGSSPSSSSVSSWWSAGLWSLTTQQKKKKSFNGHFSVHLKENVHPCVNLSDRTTVGYKHTWMLGKRYSMNVSYKIFCGWDFTIQYPAAATLKHSFIRNDLKVKHTVLPCMIAIFSKQTKD